MKIRKTIILRYPFNSKTNITTSALILNSLICVFTDTPCIPTVGEEAQRGGFELHRSQQVLVVP
jgi:hypothetical protein